MVSSNVTTARSLRAALLLGALAGAALAGSTADAQTRRPGARASASAQASASASAPPSAPAPLASGSAPPEASASASAEPGPRAPSSPRVHHAPVAWAPLREPLTLRAGIEHPDLMRRAVVLYGPAGGKLQEAEFKRSTVGPYAAVIPAEVAVAPGFVYCVEVELLDGSRAPVFATRDEPQEVQVHEAPEDVRERALLARLDGRRSVVTVSGEYVYFGKTDTVVQRADGQNEPQSVLDRYYRVEAGYTYRMLGTIAEFGIRGGVVRGRSVVETDGKRDPSKFDVGLNYGAPQLRLRAADWLHLEGELLTSVTEVGFSTGGGGAVLLGDPYGDRLTLGFESIQTFGSRYYFRLDLVVARLVGVAPVVEVTDMPHSDKFGVRLLTEISMPLGGGLTAAGRLGYQARDAASGGPSGGLSFSYAF